MWIKVLTCGGQMLNYVDKSIEVWTKVLNCVDKVLNCVDKSAELCGQEC